MTLDPSKFPAAIEHFGERALTNAAFFLGSNNSESSDG